MVTSRQAERKSVSFSTTLLIGDKSIKCDILDISTGGAKIKVRSKAERGDKITITIEPAGNFAANIAWNREGTLGIKFEDDPLRVAEAVMMLATYS